MGNELRWNKHIAYCLWACIVLKSSQQGNSPQMGDLLFILLTKMIFSKSKSLGWVSYSQQHEYLILSSTSQTGLNWIMVETHLAWSSGRKKFSTVFMIWGYFPLYFYRTTFFGGEYANCYFDFDISINLIFPFITALSHKVATICQNILHWRLAIFTISHCKKKNSIVKHILYCFVH